MSSLARLRRPALASVFVAMVAAVAYREVLRFGFVYDDHWTVEHNRWLAMPLGSTLALLLRGRGQASGIPDATRPTMFVSTWLDHHAFGPRPMAFHAHSLALYALVCALAYLALLVLSGRRRAAVAGALLFAVAPMHAEVVGAINYREDLLSALGVLVPLVLLMRRRTTDGPISFAEATIAAASWALGLFAKESALVLLPILAAAMYARGVTRAWLRVRERALLALGVVLLLWCNWRAALFIKGDDVPRAAMHGVVDMLARTARFEVTAVMHACAPFMWSPEYARPASASPWWLLPFALIVAATVVIARWRFARPYALALAMALLAPVAASPLLRPVNEIADRYFFLSALGAALAAGLFWDRWLMRQVGRSAATAMLSIAVLGLAVICTRAARPWRSDETLWAAAVERAPDSPRAWTGLARTRRLAGDIDRADSDVAHALEIDPNYLPARLTRAYNELARGNVARAQLEIDEITARGGATLGGLSRARRCAALEPERARRCATASP